jgi:hypothetical protein
MYPGHRILVCLLTCISLISATQARADKASAGCDFDYFNSERLQRYFQDHEVKKMSEILSTAPDCFKSHQVAVYDSQSLQCATPKAPRIILYAGDGNESKSNTVCTFNSGTKEDYKQFYDKDPNINCHEGSLECQHFNGKKFEYYEVTVPRDEYGKPYFSNLPNRAKVSAVNPPQCMTSCHRGTTQFAGAPNPRPNMESYPGWPGIYGSMHDNFEATPSEGENYLKKFYPYKKVNARYASLPDILGVDLKYNDNIDTSKPVVDLHNLLEIQNIRRIAAEFTDPSMHDKVWPFRYAVLGSLMCNDDVPTASTDPSNFDTLPPAHKFRIESFIPENVRAKFKTSFEQLASEALRERQGNLKALVAAQAKAGPSAYEQFQTIYDTDIQADPSRPDTTWKLQDREDFFGATRLAYLGENLGVPTSDWGMSFLTTYDFTAGHHNISELKTYLAPVLLDPVADKDLHLTLDTYLTVPVDSSQCELLRKKSLATIQAAFPEVGGASCVDPTSQNVVPTAVVEAQKASSAVLTEVASLKYPKPPSALESCIRCHVNGQDAEEHPFPFSNSSNLALRLNQPVHAGAKATLLNTAIDYIRSGRMPQDLQLSDTEKNDLIKYFQKTSEIGP